MSENKTYRTIDSPQRSEDWVKQRKGKLTMFNLGSALGVGYETRETIAKRVLGIIPEVKENFAMMRGTAMEPVAKAWYETTYKVTVEEYSLCIPLWDERLGGSPDGVVGEGIIEIKCPIHMYKGLRDYTERKKKGEKFEVGYKDHIVPAHYAQMQGCMKILGKKWCDYIVYRPPDVFVERIFFNEDYWNNFVVPGINSFYNEVIETIKTEIANTDSVGSEVKPAEPVKPVSMTEHLQSTIANS